MVEPLPLHLPQDVQVWSAMELRLSETKLPRVEYRMMCSEYSIDVVVLCCIVAPKFGYNDIGMPFDCFDLADNAHLDVSSHTEVEVARAIVKDP
jgi:hypothetical protein